MPPGVIDCPILCLTKVCLYVITTMFMLYLPLGDSQVIFDSKNDQSNEKGLMCLLCGIYDLMTKIVDKAVQTTDTLSCITADALHEGKLKVYSVLSNYDREDYCKVGRCCDAKEGEASTGDATARRSRCRCRRKYCRKR